MMFILKTRLIFRFRTSDVARSKHTGIKSAECALRYAHHPGRKTMPSGAVAEPHIHYDENVGSKVCSGGTSHKP